MTEEKDFWINKDEVGILWTDDARIVDLHAHKYYSDDPHIEITVKEL